MQLNETNGSGVVSSKLICSVIVPVYNGEATIRRTLDALADQSVPHGAFEILVVDDGSTDRTTAIVTEWIEDHAHLRAKLLQQENAGPAAARNRGAKESQAPILLFTDADCAPLRDWIECMAAPFGLERCGPNVALREPSPHAAQVIGAKGTYVTEQIGLVPNFVQVEYEDRYDRMKHLPQIDFIDTYSAAYLRNTFWQNEGFDPVFTTASVEDQEFSFRLAQKGYKMLFVPDAKVSHLHDEHVGEYWRRKYFIGYWKALLTRWHPERLVQDSHTPQILKVQMALWGSLLGLLPLALVGSLWSPLRWLWLPFLAGLALFLATTVPFVRKLARRSWRLALIGPGMIAVRSVALGAGYLHGTIHFAGTIHGMRQPVIPGWKRVVKRVMDVALALLGLLVTFPLILLAALAIKLDSDGPIFFRQRRIGEHGAPFEIIKLRSMVCDAEERLGELIDIAELSEPVYKIADDPRVTRVGRLLRRTSLDEIPQFFNVLRGQMSMVGPRPEEEALVELYNDEQRRRLHVKPGLTGPMQVHGRGNLSLRERLRLEQEYIDNYSLSRDLQILWRTVPAIIRGDGAF